MENSIPPTPVADSNNVASSTTSGLPLKRNNTLIYLLAAVIVGLVIIIVILLTRNSGTPANVVSNPVGKTPGSTIVSPVTTAPNDSQDANDGGDEQDQVVALDVNAQSTTYNSNPGPVDSNNKPYVAFDTCDNSIPVCTHYLLANDKVNNFPILSTALDGQTFIISGNYDSNGGAAAGNRYYTLTDNIKIQALVQFLGKQPDNVNYGFKTCVLEISSCKMYFLPIADAGKYTVISQLHMNDMVKISGGLHSEGGAAGTSYATLIGDIVIEK